MLTLMEKEWGDRKIDTSPRAWQIDDPITSFPALHQAVNIKQNLFESYEKLQSVDNIY